MLIKIEPEEREPLERICATFDLTCRIYTMENNPQLMQAEIMNSDGKELEHATVWYLCTTVQNRVFADRLTRI